MFILSIVPLYKLNYAFIFVNKFFSAIIFKSMLVTMSMIAAELVFEKLSNYAIYLSFIIS